MTLRTCIDARAALQALGDGDERHRAAVAGAIDALVAHLSELGYAPPGDDRLAEIEGLVGAWLVDTTHPDPRRNRDGSWRDGQQPDSFQFARDLGYRFPDATCPYMKGTPSRAAWLEGQQQRLEEDMRRAPR